VTSILTLLKWDIILLYRNKLFHVSVAITLVYIALFYLLKSLGNLHIPLIILIYNDPVIISYMFSGVLWLTDRNQNTMQAISVLPLQKIDYLISKTLALSSLAVILAFIMSIAAVGTNFNPFHLITSVFFSSLMFCAFGFTLGSLSNNFLGFLMKSLPLFILSAIPMVILFDLLSPIWFSWIPTLGGVMILQSAFVEKSFLFISLGYLSLIVWAWFSIKVCKYVTLKRIQ